MKRSTSSWSILHPLSAILVFALLAGCDDAPSNLPTVKLPVGSQTFTAEVANTPATREKGLMERDSMPADHGMIFVFPDEAPRSFWMHHTRFPLDILYVNAAGKVVAYKQMKAYDETTVPSVYPAKYAIELNLGTVDKTGAKVGDVIAIPDAAKETKE